MLLAILNPFEIVQWSEERSRLLWERLHAHDYPGTPDGKVKSAEPAGRSAITVIYYDDASLNRANQKRPLRLYDLSNLIQDIRYTSANGGAPLGIFVDMLLTDANGQAVDGQALIRGLADHAVATDCAARKGTNASPTQCLLFDIAELTKYKEWEQNGLCQINSAAKIACILGAKGTPILFADPALGENITTSPDRAPTPLIDALAQVALTVPVGIEPHRYPLITPIAAQERRDRRYALYPAAALYSIWCAHAKASVSRDGQRPCKASPVGTPDIPPIWNEDFVDPLDIEWAIPPDNGQTDEDQQWSYLARQQTCHYASPGFWNSLGRLVRLSFAGIKWSGRYSPCLYTRAYPSDIVQSAGFSPDFASSIFHDRLVIIGGQFSDSNDVLAAAPFSHLPGVYVHAMALDNLIERGSQYTREPRQISDNLSLSTGDLFNLAVFFCIALILAIATKMLNSRYYPGFLDHRAWRIAVWHMAVLLLGLVFICFTLTFFVRLSIRPSWGGVDILHVLRTFFVEPDAEGIWAGHVVPPQFNAVGATVIVIIGMSELTWAAIAPLRETIGHRFSLRRIWTFATTSPAASPSSNTAQGE